MKPIIKQIQQLIPLSSPLLIAKMGIPIRGLAVTWIFAELGPESLAAGALSYSLLMAALTFLLGVLMSSVGVTVAYATGADNKQAVATALQQGLWLGLILSIPCTLMFIHAELVFNVLGQAPGIAEEAACFAHGLAWLFIPYTLVICLIKLFVNLKRSHIPMIYSFWGLFVTVLASYCLGLGKFGCPKMGITGVGWAMSLSYWSQALIMVLHVKFSKLTRGLGIFRGLFEPQLSLMRKLWHIGWPIGLKYNIEFFLFFAIAAAIGALRPSELSAYQVILQLFMLSSCLSNAVGMSTEALVGQAVGRRHKHAITPTCYAGLALASFYTAMLALVVLLFPNTVARLFFAAGSADFNLLLQTFAWVVAFLFLDGLRKVLTDILVVLQSPRFTLIAEIIGLWGISFPLGYWLSLTTHHGLNSFLWGLVIGLCFSVAAMMLRFRNRLMHFTTQL